MDSEYIIENGQERYRNTDDFRKKEKEIRVQIDLKYKELWSTEKNILKKGKLKFQKRKELRKALGALNSKDILFVS